jgi:hypothetical protein
LATDWVSKELSLTARPAEVSVRPGEQAIADVAVGLRAQLDWLSRLAEAARAALLKAPSFGLFGSAIAASWLGGQLADGVSFFVEEDVNRVGRSHMGKQILAPAEVPAGSVVFVPLIPAIAKQVGARLASFPIDLRLPPD